MSSRRKPTASTCVGEGMQRLASTAALLFAIALSTGCAHQVGEPATASLDAAPLLEDTAASEAEGEYAGEEEYEGEEELEYAAAEGQEVITFEIDGSDTMDTVIAPPKREDIPGFKLFGTGETTSQPGPRLTLPDDME